MSVFGRNGLVVAASLLLAGCSGVSTSAPPPEMIPPPGSPPPPVSSLSATLTVPLSELSRLVNERTPQRLADLDNQRLRCGIGDCLASLQAMRTGPIGIYGRNGALAFGVPFAVEARIALPPPLTMMNAGVNAQGQLNASASLALGPDWQIRPNTGGSVQFQNGRLRIGMLDTDFANIWNSNPELLSRPLFGILDAQIAQGLALQKPMAQLWAGVFAPVRLNTKPATWLVLQPERIRVGLPAVTNDALTVGLGVDVRARLVASEDRPDVTPTMLPPPGAVNGPSNHFAVRVPVVVTYGEAARLAMEALDRNPPRVGSHTLKITKLEVLPSGQDVVIAASFCITQNWDPADVLSGCGSGYLRGVPRYDAQSRTIRVVNVHYDVLTENWMLSAMRGLAGNDLGRQLEKGLQFQVGDQIRKIQEQVSASLARPQGNVVAISGAVQTYGPVSLTWSREGFIASFSAEGTLHADLRM